MLAGNTAAFAGGLKEVDRVADVIGEALNAVPGVPLPGSVIGDWWAQAARLAVGIPFPRVQPAFDSLMRTIERRTEGAKGTIARQQFATPLYLAYLASREPRYADAMGAWAAWMKDLPEINALRAITAGDSAKARAIAADFPEPDTTRAKENGITVARWVARAQALEELGDLPGAIAMYEVIEPRHISQWGRVDVALPLYARTLLARGRVYEELGEREKAANAYRDFLETWRDADPELEPQKEEARAGLARLGDAPVSR